MNGLVETFINHLCAGGKSAATVRWSRQRLDQFARWLNDENHPVSSLTVEHLDAYAASLYTRGLSRHTVHGHRKLIAQFLRWCFQRGHLPTNPAKDWRPGRPRSPDAESKSVRLDDAIALLEVCAESIPPRHLRDSAIIRLLFSTGLRAGELLSLHLRDLHWRDGRCCIHIRAAKGGKHRRAWPDNITAAAIRAWLDARPAAHADNIFIGSNGENWRPLTYNSLRQILRRLCRRAGVAASLHGFRHAFAITFLESGGNLSELADLLGHSDVRVTKEFYGSYETDRLARAAERHSPGKALARHIEEEKTKQLWFPTCDAPPDQGTMRPLVPSPSPGNGSDDP